MVNDSGQLYTIEGVAAAVLMVVTAYLVISTTTILTPQDVHIIDMQLEQLGSDALAMMDTADSYGNESVLAQAVRNNDAVLFDTTFLRYINASAIAGPDNLAYDATIYYRNNTGINSFTFTASPYYRENAVMVSRWVYLPNFRYDHYPTHSDMRNETQSMLVEVLLWRV